MSRAGTLTDGDLAELEGHLRGSVADLSGRGLDNEEALLVALRRIGDPNVLAVEFHKVNPGLAWARRWYWMSAGFLGFSIAVQAIEAMSYLAGWYALPVGWSVAGVLATGLVGYLAIGLSIVRSSKSPGGRVARALQRAVTWIQRRPIVTGTVALGCLVGLRAANGAAKGAVWGNLEGLAVSLASVDALAAVGVPILLFFLGRHVNLPRHEVMD